MKQIDSEIKWGVRDIIDSCAGIEGDNNYSTEFLDGMSDEVFEIFGFVRSSDENKWLQSIDIRVRNKIENHEEY
jgi:hypothetical protein